MSEKIKKVIPILEFITSLDKKERTKFLKKCKNPIIKAITDVVYNVLVGNLSISSAATEKLRVYKNQIKSLKNNQSQDFVI